MSPVNSEANETVEQAARPSIGRAWYRTSVGVAIIGGVFSLVVCVLLLSNHLHVKTSDPLNSKKLNDLRVSLLRQPGDDSIKEQIRALDLQLRREYFRRREFSRRGSYLLIGSISVFLMGVKYAVKYREKLPMPQPIREDESRNARLARWSVGIFGATIGGIALVFSILGTGYRIPDSGIRHPASSIQTYPSQEEIKKNWPRFRGPGGLGISAYTNIPSSWNGNTGEGIIWKTPIPLPGVNSPIVWDERVFLTGADEERREIYCFDANSGEMLWQRAVENIPFSSPEPPEVSEDTGFAAPTAATDGQRVYAIFADGDLVCFDFNGKQIWSRNVGPFDNMYGYASSLAMYKNLLLVLLDQGQAEDELSELIAVEATTGRTIWSARRPVPNSWASPIVTDNGEREEIITCGNPWVIAYEPTTGKELWRVECLGGDVAPSPIYATTGGDARTTGLVFVTNAYEVLAAIRLGGQGDVTDTHIVWTAEDGLPDICSPLSNGELVFLLETYGLLTCYDARNGTKVWEEDLVETFKASPSLVGDRIYLMTEDGIMIIIKADREFKEIGRCELGEAANASPAFMDGRIYIRGEENLYCIANVPK
jgi:outer membrane protein assembly factor BamB